MQKAINIIFGTTASGKTELAVRIAKTLKNPAIINADSMQIYKEIPIITNQPSEDEKQGIEHFLFGVNSIIEHSDLTKWLDTAGNLVKKLQNENRDIIFVGGTGMYLKAIIEGVSQIPDIPREVRENILKEIELEGIEKIYKNLIALDKKAKILNPADTQRIIRALEVILHTKKSIFDYKNEPQKKFFEADIFEINFIEIDRQKTYEKINNRFKKMLELGAVEEAINANKIFEKAINVGKNISDFPAHKAHGLRELIAYSKGEISLEKAIELGSQVTRNYAKRQLTWWRGWKNDLKEGVKVNYC
jgi:tRNA dimethylallyltransferase